jgi:hypothetical protein
VKGSLDPQALHPSAPTFVKIPTTPLPALENVSNRQPRWFSRRTGLRCAIPFAARLQRRNSSQSRRRVFGPVVFRAAARERRGPCTSTRTPRTRLRPRRRGYAGDRRGRSPSSVMQGHDGPSTILHGMGILYLVAVLFLPTSGPCVVGGRDDATMLAGTGGPGTPKTNAFVPRRRGYHTISTR